MAVDLFAGAGGMSLGFERAGYDVLAAVEYDPVHAATHLYNFPNTAVLCRDIKSISGQDLIASAKEGWAKHYPDAPEFDGHIDVVFGGPSCQGFSVMGRRDVDDERNLLVVEFARLVAELKPKIFCMENVPGFLDPRFSPVRDEVVRLLAESGYTIKVPTAAIDATDFGVPQRRSRIFVVGALDSAKIENVAPVASSVKTTVADAFSGLPSVIPTPLAGTSDLVRIDAKEWRLTNASSKYLRSINSPAGQAGNFGHPRSSSEEVLSGFRATAHSASTIERFSETAEGKSEPRSRAFRLDRSMPSRTLRAGTGRERGSFSAARPIHPTQPRVVTVREAARLHSFPDWFRFHVTNWHAHRQIGNAVPPLLAQAVAAALLGGLGVVPSASSVASARLGDEALRSMSMKEAALHFGANEDEVPKARLRPIAGDAANSEFGETAA